MTNPNYPPGVTDRDIDALVDITDTDWYEVEVTIYVSARMQNGRLRIDYVPTLVDIEDDVRRGVLKAHADEKAYQRDESEDHRDER